MLLTLVQESVRTAHPGVSNSPAGAMVCKRLNGWGRGRIEGIMI